MNINLAPVDEEYIKNKVEAGYYSNFAEGVRDAVRKMRERDEQYNELVAAVMLGERDIAQGNVKPYTPALMEQIKQKARAKAARGEKPNPDVIP
jgi:putative addiction module CopG family antidote